jgi:hypothetical protein
MSGVLEYPVHLVLRDNGLCPQQLAPGCHAPRNSGYFVLCLGRLKPEFQRGRTLGRLRCSDHALSLLDCHDQEKCEGFGC